MALLAHRALPRIAGAVVFVRLHQVGVGGKAGQIVALMGLAHGVDDPRHLLHGFIPIPVAHRHWQPRNKQVLPRKGRLQLEPAVPVGRGQDPSVEIHGREGRRKQRHTAHALVAAVEVLLRREAPQPQLDVVPRTLRADQRPVDVLVELLRHTDEPVAVQHQLHRVLVAHPQLLRLCGELRCGAHQLLRRLPQRVVLRVLHRQLGKQRRYGRKQHVLLPEHRRDARAQLRHALPRQRRRVHLPGAVGQVVGLVDEQARAALAVEVALQPNPGIEHVVVIADHYVGQLRQIQRQLEGTDFKLPRQFGDGLRIQHLHLHGPPQRLPAALEVAVAVAAQRAVRLALKADLLLCGQRHRSNAQSISAHQVQRILRRATARGARGEIEHAGHLPRAQRLQRAVERRRRLADAGGGLDQRASARAQRILHAVCHLPLALAELREGKAQALKRRFR